MVAAGYADEGSVFRAQRGVVSFKCHAHQPGFAHPNSHVEFQSTALNEAAEERIIILSSRQRSK